MTCCLPCWTLESGVPAIVSRAALSHATTRWSSAPTDACRTRQGAEASARQVQLPKKMTAPKAFPRVAMDLATTVERIQQNFVIADPHLPDCPIVFASDGFLELTEYSREEILGRNCRFLQVRPPETAGSHLALTDRVADPPAVQAAVQSAHEKDMHCCKPVRATHPGHWPLSSAWASSGPAAVEQGQDTDPDAVAEIRDAVRNGSEASVRLLNYKKSGKPFWNMFTLAPMADVDGNLRFIIGVQVRL
jgi:PAS domain